MIPSRAATRTMTNAGQAQLVDGLSSYRRRPVQTSEDDRSLASSHDNLPNFANREEVPENITGTMRATTSGQRQPARSKAPSVRSGSSSMKSAKRRQLEFDMERARLKEEQRQLNLKTTQDLLKAKNAADNERIADQMQLLEQRSQLALDEEDEEEEDEVFDEARSDICPPNVNEWMRAADDHDDQEEPEILDVYFTRPSVPLQDQVKPPTPVVTPEVTSKAQPAAKATEILRQKHPAQTKVPDQMKPPTPEVTSEVSKMPEPNPIVQTQQPVPDIVKADSSSINMSQFSETFAEAMKNLVQTLQPTRNDDVNGFLARQCGGAKDLPDFYGDPEDWISFSQRFDTTTNLCMFSHDENLIRLQKCLKGKARESVNAMINSGCHPGDVMRVLEKRFGRPEMIFNRVMERVRCAPSPLEGDFNGIVELSVVVKNLCATAKSLKLQAYLTNPQLLDDLKRKLPSSLQYEWGKFMMHLHRIATIKDFSDFLEEVSDAAAFVCDFTPSRRKQKENGKPLLQMKETVHCSLSCKDTHSIASCPKFKKMSADDRWETVKKSGFCFSCLGKGHRTIDCKKKKQCGENGCTRRHHAMLHGANPSKEQSAPQRQKHEPQPTLAPRNTPQEEAMPLNVMGNVRKQIAPIGNVLMKILPVEVNGHKCNVFLDDGAGVTVIDEAFAKGLGLKGERRPLTLALEGGITDHDPGSMLVSLKIRGIDESQEYAVWNVRTKKDLQLPVQPLSDYKCLKRWNHLNAVPFPEVLPSRPVMVIGEDNLHLMLGRKLVEGSSCAPVASWTYLGWVVHGPCGRPSGAKFPQLSIMNIENVDPDQALHELVKESFRLESLGIVNCPNIPMSACNKRADEMMETLSFKADGRWTAPMLWKRDNLELPNNWPAARKRLTIQEREMDKDAELAEMYCKKIDEYLEKGFCHKLSSEELSKEQKRVWFLPHFGNKNPNKPGKIRLVFDAAAKYDGMSLNDALIQGRDLMSPLMNVLMKFRHYEVAFSGDIRDMFHMVQIRQEDLPSLRFLWRGKDRTRCPDVYQMDVMVFGAVSSPYQAQWIKNRNAFDYIEEYPEAVDAIHNRHYVDDYLDSCKTPEEAIKKIMDVREIHRHGGFEIRGWNCNEADVLKVVAPGEQPPDFISLSDEKMERVLGLHWKPKDDIFTFKTSFNRVDPAIISGEKIPTKRQLLQLVMSMFDPLGFIGHLTARGRMLLQHVWKSGVGWDDTIVGVAADKWSQFLAQVMQLSQVRIRRCFAPKISDGTNVQVHTFCDASQQAFGAVTYLRVVGSDQKVSVNIVMSKTRVTPIKAVSIPRLELEAALVGARQTNYFRTMFEMKIDGIVLWTDSRNVIYWLRAEDPSRFKMYVAHRIGEILDLTDVSSWRWVPTADNVADDCTRDGCAADVTPSSRWFIGPEFLTKNETEWPTEPKAVKDVKKEELETKAVFMTMREATDVLRVEDFSCWMRLIRVTAWILRYRSNLQRKPDERRELKYLTVGELKNAELFWIKKVQAEMFPEEIACLAENRKIDGHSKIVNLSPILVDGVIRMDSRVINSPVMSANAKAPVILDRSHPWTRLVVEWYHKLHGHMGIEKIANELRQNYWILRLKNLVKKVASDCLECKLRRAKPICPRMAALPEVRVTRPSRAFSFVGVDYFGPLDIVHGRKHEKRYGALFT